MNFELIVLFNSSIFPIEFVMTFPLMSITLKLYCPFELLSVILMFESFLIGFGTILKSVDLILSLVDKLVG